MLEKFKSRKFILSLLTMIAAVVGSLSGVGGTAGTVCCIIGAIISPMIYIVTEGMIDAKAVEMTTDAVKEILDALGVITDSTPEADKDASENQE